MRHRRRVKHFSRDKNARKALLRSLVSALVTNGRISTTVDKAKEVRRHVEKAITLGKKGNLASYRLIHSRYPSNDVAATIINDVAPRFKARSGGYTRIIKIGRRPGDTAEMAFLEFVDFDFAEKAAKAMDKTAAAKPAKKTKSTKAASKTKTAKKAPVKKAATKKASKESTKNA